MGLPEGSISKRAAEIAPPGVAGTNATCPRATGIDTGAWIRKEPPQKDGQRRQVRTQRPELDLLEIRIAGERIEGRPQQTEQGRVLDRHRASARNSGQGPE